MSTSPSPLSPDHLSTLTYRLAAVEHDIKAVRDQLNSYVPIRENELQLKIIQETVARIERDVIETKKQVSDLNTKLIAQELEARDRDNQQKQSQSNLQIKAMWAIIGIVITVVTGSLISYVSYLIHH